MMRNCIDIIWPHLQRNTDFERQELIRRDINLVESTNWNSASLVLEEARALYSKEEDRRKTAESKAAIYLAAVATISTLVISIIAGVFSKLEFIGNLQLTLLAIIFGFSIIYLLASGIWAFKVLQVSVVHRVDVVDLVKLNNEPKFDVALCNKILACVRKNEHCVNEMVSRFIMAHKFLVRTFVLYIFLMICITILTILPRIV